MPLQVILGGLLAFAGTVGLILALGRAAHLLNLLDRPDSRKQHDGETPLVGGLSIFGGLMIAGLVLDGFFSGRNDFFIGLGALLLTGVMDDRGGLPPNVRLLTQVLAVLVMVIGGGIQLDNLGDLFGTGDVVLGKWATPLTVFAVVGVINAMNMIDGVDGLAGGIALTALLIFFVFSHSDDPVQATLPFLLSFSVTGFLLFNMRVPWRARAYVFLGDAGSMMLGFVLGWYAVDLASVREVFTPITAIWILAVPLMDTVSLMIRRMLRRKSPFAPDREHLHHVLQRAGFSHGETVVIVWLFSLVLACVGMTGWWLGIPEYVMFYGFMSLFGLYFLGTMHAWRLMRVIRRAHDGMEISSPEQSEQCD